MGKAGRTFPKFANFTHNIKHVIAVKIPGTFELEEWLEKYYYMPNVSSINISMRELSIVTTSQPDSWT